MWIGYPECNQVVGIKCSPKPSGSWVTLIGGSNISLGRWTWYEADPELTHSQLQFVEGRMMVRLRPSCLWYVCGKQSTVWVWRWSLASLPVEECFLLFISSPRNLLLMAVSTLTSPNSVWDCNYPSMFYMIYQWSHLGLEYALCKRFEILISLIFIFSVSCPLLLICVF